MAKAQKSNPQENQKSALDRLVDEALKDYQNPEQITGPEGLLKQLTKRLVEKAMEKEMDDHLGYPKHSVDGYNNGNSRNGHSSKTIKGDFGEVEIETPRDREASFEPKIVPKSETHFKGFDQKIISMYSRGMTTRDIQSHLQ